MAKIDYEFDRDRGRKNRAGIYFRLGIIFLFVAGLTAGIIWFLIPKSGDRKTEGLPVPKTALTVPAQVPAVETAVTPGTPAETPAAAKETPLPTEAAVVESPNDVADNTPASVPRETPTLLPEKGKPWVGDPVVDLPKIPQTVIPVVERPVLNADFARAEEAMKEKNDPAVVAAVDSILASGAVTPGSAEWRRAAALLTKAHLTEFQERKAVEGETKWYVARPGDSFSRVAARFDTTIGAIKHYNRIAEDDNILRIAQKLLLLPGPWKIVIRKGPRLLELSRNGRLYAAFDVGLGRAGKTPKGKFVISSKLKNPDWYMPDGGIVRYGDPDNPLGSRFLKLAPIRSQDRPLSGYGIHGTRGDGSDITHSLSNGCIRMRNSDVEALYLIVPARTPVEIVE